MDNNALSNYFSESFSTNAMSFIAEVIDNGPNISIITEIEALSWINPDKDKERIVQEFVKASNRLPLTALIVERCIAIRRSKKIKTPDAILAATAIVHDLILISSDSDFDNIPGLKVIDPIEL